MKGFKGGIRVKRTLLLLLVLSCFPCARWGRTWTMRTIGTGGRIGRNTGTSIFCDVQDDTLIIFEGVTALGRPEPATGTTNLEKDIEIEPKFVGWSELVDLRSWRRFPSGFPSPPPCGI
jgi:hypothetical protein